jgi:hypothetical protein
MDKLGKYRRIIISIVANHANSKGTGNGQQGTGKTHV